MALIGLELDDFLLLVLRVTRLVEHEVVEGTPKLEKIATLGNTHLLVVCELGEVVSLGRLKQAKVAPFGQPGPEVRYFEVLNLLVAQNL